MKAVMKSVSPQICEKITSGNCTLLVSKTAPKCDAPFKGYIYCTKAKSQWRYSDYEGAYQNSEGDIVYAQRRVIGEFICDEIIEWQYDKGHQYYVGYPDDCTSYFPYLMRHSEATGLRCSEIEKFGKGKTLYGWNLSDLKIYDTPKTLGEFYKCGAGTIEELFDVDGLCQYCSETNYGEHSCSSSPNGMICCEGRWCDEAYEAYLEENFAITRAPKSYMYVTELDK